MQALEQRIGYSFKDKALLRLSLTHPSNIGQASNQRLEFLGDSILAACVAPLLYQLFPDEAEGSLALRLNALVGGPMLSRLARELELGGVLILGTGEEQKGGRNNASNLEDALEALIGAIYIDGGFEAAREFVLRFWQPLAREVSMPSKDAKTALQEWAQARGLGVPVYTLISSAGAAHAPFFVIEVSVQGYAPAQGEASTKRAAQQAGAALLLKTLEQKA